MTEDLISVIVPVYNAEKYLVESVNSITRQTYKNLQIILIDDGSRDSSLNICHDLASADTRIEVLHQENAGQAIARNNAIKRANGKYVVYVDSDDYIVENFIEIFVSISEKSNAELVSCQFLKFFDDDSILPRYIDNVSHKCYSKEEALEQILYQRVFNQGPCCKLIKTEIAKNNPFPEGMIYEDLATVYRWFNECKIIASTDVPLYYYRQRKGSTMRSVFSNKKFDRITVTSEMKSFIEKNYRELVKPMSARWFLSNLQVLMELPFSKEYRDKKKELKANIKESRGIVLKDPKAKKSLRCMALVTYFGVNITMVAGRLYNKIINKA